MVKYKISQPEIVKSEFQIRPFKLKISFDRGTFGDCQYLASELYSLWSLVGLIASVDEEFFFEVSREDEPLTLKGCFVQDRFCLFYHQNEKNIAFLNKPEIDFDNLDLIEVMDKRWPMIFFLPRCSFFSFEDLVEIGSKALRSGRIKLKDFTDFPQTFLELGIPPKDYYQS